MYWRIPEAKGYFYVLGMAYDKRRDVKSLCSDGTQFVRLERGIYLGAEEEEWKLETATTQCNLWEFCYDLALARSINVQGVWLEGQQTEKEKGRGLAQRILYSVSIQCIIRVLCFASS